MGYLITLFIIFLIFSSIFKLSVGLIKFAFTIFGILFVLILIPIALIAFIPILCIGLGLRLIFR